MAERISLSIACNCGATLRMSMPSSGYMSNDEKRGNQQGEVAKAFLAAHQCCGEAE